MFSELEDPNSLGAFGPDLVLQIQGEQKFRCWQPYKFYKCYFIFLVQPYKIHDFFEFINLLGVGIFCKNIEEVNLSLNSSYYKIL